MNRRQLFGATSAVLAMAAMPAFADQALPSSSFLAQARAALAKHQDRIRNLDRVAVVDFGQHSSKPRFHLIDVAAGTTQSFLVAHGRGSDPTHTGWLKSFSNQPGSDATSEGAYLTGEAYDGAHGHSRRLIGLDDGNSNALSRGIVIHSAWYVTPAMAAGAGIGRSEGCFALSEADHTTVMNALGPDRLLLAIKA